MEKEWLKFFVTNKVVTQVAIQSSSTNIFLGDENSVAFGVAEILYGIDLDEMTPTDILQTEEQLLITLPQPKVLSVSIRQDSIKVMTKSSLLRRLSTLAVGGDIENELRSRLASEATAFASANGLFPPESEIDLYLQEFFNKCFPLLKS